MSRSRSLPDRYEAVRLLPSAGVLAVWTVLMFEAGGFDEGTWHPAGLVLLGLLFVAAVGSGRLLPAAPLARNALLALAAFTAWCFLSTLWSDAPGTTFEAADLLLVALLGCWTLALAPWRAGTADGLMIGFAVAAAVACLVALLSALGAEDLTSRFEDLRFSPPLDYPNSTAAFALMAGLPALLLAARPDTPLPARAVGQGLAAFLCGYALLPQSRGSVIGGLAALVILAVAVPFRWRLTMHAALLAIGLLVVAGPASDVYTQAAATGKASGALEDAAVALLGVALLSTVAGGLLAFAQQRYSHDQRVRRASRPAGIAFTALAVLAVLAVGIAKSGSISDSLSDQWRSLKNPGVEFSGRQANDGGSRLASIDPLERYDYWRVSFAGFRSAPIWGMGAAGFEHRYTKTRRYPKLTRYPHNLALKVLGDTGLIGTALIGAFLGIVGFGLLRRRRGRPTGDRVVAATGLVTLGYFVAHGMFDWVEAYPVLAGPALAFPLVALVVSGRRERLEGLEVSRAEPRSSERSPRRAAAPAWIAAGLVALFAGLSLLGPWLANRYRERAADTWRENPTQAYRDLDRAADLDPFGTEALILKGVIALTRADYAGASGGFSGALDREDTWLPHFGLGTVALEAGDRAAAEREFAEAERLNPRDVVLPAIVDEALAAKMVDPAGLIRDVLTSPYSTVEALS